MLRNPVLYWGMQCSFVQEVIVATKSSSSVLQRPKTRLGWWAGGLALGFLVMYIVNAAVFMRLSQDVPWRLTLLPFYGILMMLCGIAAGIVGALAILRNHERSWLVWLAIALGVDALLFIVGEFL